MLHDKIHEIIRIFKSKVNDKKKEIIEIISSQYSNYEIEKLFSERLPISDTSSESAFIISMLDVKDEKIASEIKKIIQKLSQDELRKISSTMNN